MKAISLWQPWATLWVLRIKKNETRSWPLYHRGPLAIHAADKRINIDDYGDSFKMLVFDELEKHGIKYVDIPYKAIIGQCDKLNIYPSERYKFRADISSMESTLGDYSRGRYIYEPINMRALKAPIPFSGRQKLFDIDDCLLDSDHLTSSPGQQLKLF